MELCDKILQEFHMLREIGVITKINAKQTSSSTSTPSSTTFAIDTTTITFDHRLLNYYGYRILYDTINNAFFLSHTRNPIYCGAECFDVDSVAIVLDVDDDIDFPINILNTIDRNIENADGQFSPKGVKTTRNTKPS